MSACEITNERTGKTYTDLQAAINDASLIEIDTLEISGTCKGNFVIDKSLKYRSTRGRRNIQQPKCDPYPQPHEGLT